MSADELTEIQALALAALARRKLGSAMPGEVAVTIRRASAKHRAVTARTVGGALRSLRLLGYCARSHEDEPYEITDAGRERAAVRR